MSSNPFDVIETCLAPNTRDDDDEDGDAHDG